MPWNNYVFLNHSQIFYIRSVLNITSITRGRIAELLHLSEPSVSRILNSRQRIKREKRDHLFSFIEDEVLSSAYYCDDEPRNNEQTTSSDNGYIRKTRITVLSLFCNLISIEDIVSAESAKRQERFVKECGIFIDYMKKRYVLPEH